MIQSSIPTDTLHITGAQSVLTSNSFPNPQGHQRAVVRAYEKLFGRTPNWSELYYYTTMIRANPQSRAWYRQLSASQDGAINFSTGKFGSYTNAGGTGSGSGGATATRVKARRQVVATEAGGTGSGNGGPVLITARRAAAAARAHALAMARAAKHHRS